MASSEVGLAGAVGVHHVDVRVPYEDYLTVRNLGMLVNPAATRVRGPRPTIGVFGSVPLDGNSAPCEQQKQYNGQSYCEHQGRSQSHGRSTLIVSRVRRADLDPVGTEGDAPTGSRCASLGALSLLVFVFSKVQGACVHFDQLEVVLLGGLRDAFSRSPHNAEGGHKRAVLAAQCDNIRIRLVYIVVELGEHLLLHALSFRHLLRAFSLPLGATQSSLRRCII